MVLSFAMMGSAIIVLALTLSYEAIASLRRFSPSSLAWCRYSLSAAKLSHNRLFIGGGAAEQARACCLLAAASQQIAATAGTLVGVVLSQFYEQRGTRRLSVPPHQGSDHLGLLVDDLDRVTSGLKGERRVIRERAASSAARVACAPLIVFLACIRFGAPLVFARGF
jgi:hypothetical protein